VPVDGIERFAQHVFIVVSHVILQSPAETVEGI
jgi:hypothetical protein